MGRSAYSGHEPLLPAHLAFAAVALMTAAFTASTAAALEQYEGTVIPVVDETVTQCDDKNVQICLDEEEGGQTIDALAAAATTPETFNPLCDLTFHVLARGAGFNNTFGWYNVDPSGAPPPTKDEPGLYAFIECNHDPGTADATQVLSQVRDDPRYQGGEIAFFLATPENDGSASGAAINNHNCPEFDADGLAMPETVGFVYYSQREFNPDAAATQSGTSSVHLITYNSITYPNSFYFAWEDLYVDTNDNSDNDFDDLLTRVDGIICSGGGERCTTDQPGICSEGMTRCQNGEVVCVPFPPQAETCNALDDDCDGDTDEGDLCDAGEICYRGTCVGYCAGGEFACPSHLVCSSEGVCVDPACLDVICPEGQICDDGDCVGACDGVQCPYGQACRVGRCVDLCAGVTCDDGYVCHLGACSLCECAGCDDGYVCSDQICIEETCDGVDCAAGTHCEAGACIDDCDGATCPPGQLCEGGSCVDDPDAATGGGNAGGAAGSTGIGGTGARITVDAGTDEPAAGSGATSPFDQGDDESVRTVTPKGCGCRAASDDTSLPLGGLSLLALGVLVARRRR